MISSSHQTTNDRTVVKVELGGPIVTKDVLAQYAEIYTRLFADIRLGILGGRLVG